MAEPIFRCTNDDDLLVSLDDCRSCKMRCLPLPVLRMIEDYETREHAYHGAAGKYSVTELIGCLRAAALKRLGALSLETPVRLLGRTMGTVLHEKLERYVDLDSEEEEVQVEDGKIRGTIDFKADDYIIDYKFTSSIPKRIKPDHLKQLRAYRAMLGGGAVAASAWYMAFNGVAEHQLDNNPEADADVLEWLRVRAKRLHKAVENGNADELEMEGRDRRYGPKKTLCDYCPVREACEGGEVPF